VRFLGLDVGLKTTGVALSDATGSIASFQESLRGYKDARELALLVAEKAKACGAESFVIGKPLHMTGEESSLFLEIKKTGDLLAEMTGLPVAYWDERLSTCAAEKSMLEGDLSRRKRKKRIDSISAQWILQGYLDYLQEKSCP